MLRKEFANLRPAGVPDAPTHAARVAAAQGTPAGRTEQQQTPQQEARA